MYRPFQTLLVANRGEIARRVIRSAHALGLRTVAVFSDADERAPHVREADVAVRLPGLTARDTYLDGAALLRAAAAGGADAVHPGYGFLAESAAFAAAVVDAGLVWVGPPPSAMEAMAGKVGAKERMAAVGVPTLPSAVVVEGADLAAAGERVGYPLLVKASAGGGGKGMRLVRSPGELADAVAVASREAASSFGDGTVFLERHLAAPRHVEVQVLGDAHGTVLHLGDRECSIQRRHQKVVEEAPAPGLPDELRARMAAAAVSGAEALGYVGAGTFEMLLDGDDFWFLEMNTRLQVEHPVTEEVTILDLVELQLIVASGRPLPIGQDDVVVRGAAIEARLYAEDPAAGWLPSTGALHLFVPDAGDGVRWDSGVETGSVVTPHYDPMLAKAIAWAPTREAAAGRLARAIEATVVHGVTTNAGLLVGVLRDADFLAGATTTAFLEEHPALLAPPAADVTARHAAIAAVAGALARRASAPVVGFAPPGWRNVPGPPSVTVFVTGPSTVTVRYRIGPDDSFTAEVEAVTAPSPADGGPDVELGPAVTVTPLGGRVLDRLAGELDVEVDGVRRRYVLDVAGASTHVHGSDGATTLVEQPRFPEAADAATAGGLLAPVPGTVVAVHAAAGDHVAAGQVLVVLEAMKVEHSVRAPVDGTVEAVLVAAGDSVEAHAPLVRMAG